MKIGWSLTTGQQALSEMTDDKGTDVCGTRSVMSLWRLISIVGFWIVLAMPALAEKRLALVIGNGAYKHAPALANPKNDAEGMAAALKRLKFEVLTGTDLDKPAMERLLRAFAGKIEAADVTLVFYACLFSKLHRSRYSTV